MINPLSPSFAELKDTVEESAIEPGELQELVTDNTLAFLPVIDALEIYINAKYPSFFKSYKHLVEITRLNLDLESELFRYLNTSLISELIITNPSRMAKLMIIGPFVEESRDLKGTIEERNEAFCQKVMTAIKTDPKNPIPFFQKYVMSLTQQIEPISPF